MLKGVKNKNISKETQDIVVSKSMNAFEELEKRRAAFLLSKEEVINNEPTIMTNLVTEEPNIKEDKSIKMVSAEKQIKNDEENFVLQKNDEDVLNLFMDNAFQTISFYKDCNRNFFIKRNCKSYNENKDKLDKFYGDIFQSEQIKNQPENYYNEIFETNIKIPENNISKETNENIILIMKITDFLMNKNTPKKTVLNFLSEYKTAKNVYEKYEVFENYRDISSNSSVQKSKSLSKQSRNNSYKTSPYDVDPL